MDKLLTKIYVMMVAVKSFILTHYIFIVAVLFLIFVSTVWPTAYRHDVIKAGDFQMIIKTNRFTGSAWAFIPGEGWTPQRRYKGGLP